MRLLKLKRRGVECNNRDMKRLQRFRIFTGTSGFPRNDVLKIILREDPLHSLDGFLEIHFGLTSTHRARSFCNENEPKLCSAICYTFRMAQIIARIDDSFVAQVDRLVEDGVFASRSDAIRLGLELIIDQHRRKAIGDAIVKSFSQLPQSEEELVGIQGSTKALIEEEPW